MDLVLNLIFESTHFQNLDNEIKTNNLKIEVS